MKSLDLLNKKRFILWVVALPEVCDVTNNDRNLGFYQELESALDKLYLASRRWNNSYFFVTSFLF